MSDQRRHRGAHPEDAELFALPACERLREAVGDLSWLLTRGYADPSALKVVGDRYNLTARQRTAVMRCSCGDQSLHRRQEHQLSRLALSGQLLALDGYNVLTTVEAALAGGFVFHARDGCFRDMASMHGTYHKVEETVPALLLIGQTVQAMGVPACRWYLDRPVSNSGRLKQTLQSVAAEHVWNWTVDLVLNPDPLLAASPDVVATADSVILDRCPRWFNLARHIVQETVPNAKVVELSSTTNNQQLTTGNS